MKQTVEVDVADLICLINFAKLHCNPSDVLDGTVSAKDFDETYSAIENCNLILSKREETNG